MRPGKALRLLPRCYGDNSLLKRRGFILLCSHMRTRTTLLSHIVGSHPSVCGYAELHQKLRGWPDLLELCAKAEDARGKTAAHRYVLDKGLYRFARSGQLRDFTGVDAPYDVPDAPDTVVDTANQTIESCVARCFDFLSCRLRKVR